MLRARGLGERAEEAGDHRRRVPQCSCIYPTPISSIFDFSSFSYPYRLSNEYSSIQHTTAARFPTSGSFAARQTSKVHHQSTTASKEKEGTKKVRGTPASLRPSSSPTTSIHSPFLLLSSLVGTAEEEGQLSLEDV